MKIEPTTPDSKPDPSPAGDDSVGAVSATPQPPRPRGRVFDVMRPGKAPASPTSRPVIAGHKPAAQAAQVRVSGIGASGGNDSLLNSHKKTDIQPVHDAEVTTNSAPAVSAASTDKPSAPVAPVPPVSAAEVPAAPAAETPAAVWTESPFQAHKTPEPIPDATSPQEPKKGKKSEEEPEKPIDPAKLDDAALDPEPPAPVPAEPEREVPPAPLDVDHAALHEAAAPNLDGQVVVSHHTTAPKGTGRLVALIILMVLFAYVLVDILLDAGVFTLPVIPHTNFF